MANRYLTNIYQHISVVGYKLHVSVYLLCVVAGLLYMSHFTFSDRVMLAGDECDYQSIAVNFIHGHGFEVPGGLEDSTAYRLVYDPAVPYSHDWATFHHSEGRYYFYRNPIYPLFVAGVYRLASVRPDILRRLQFLMLILAGSLIPYLCYRISGTGGILPGIGSYIALLLFDCHYAFDVMSEAIIIPYIIILLLLSALLDYRHRFPQSLLMGISLGIGLLLKNYFVPLVIFIALRSLWRSFISRRGSIKHTLVLIAGIIFTILPWAIYINSKPPEKMAGTGFALITAQGSDVLLASNNEYAADGQWHSEWQQRPDSYYNRPQVKDHTALSKIFTFYYHHPPLVLPLFSAKIIRGLFATLPQVGFYLSVFALLLVRVIGRKLFSLTMLVCLCAAVLFPGIFRSVLSSASVLAMTDLYIRYMLIIITASALGVYFYQRALNKAIGMDFLILLFANFILLTLVTYGNGRITGVADVICLILLFFNISFILFPSAGRQV